MTKGTTNNYGMEEITKYVEEQTQRILRKDSREWDIDEYTWVSRFYTITEKYNKDLINLYESMKSKTKCVDFMNLW